MPQGISECSSGWNKNPLVLAVGECQMGYPGEADIIITYDNEELVRELYAEADQSIIGRKYSVSNAK